MLIEVICNDRLGKKIRVKVDSDDTVGDFKKIIAAKTGTSADNTVLKRGNTTFKNPITLADYEIHDGTSVELYYS